jgi:PKD repeat protein
MSNKTRSLAARLLSAAALLLAFGASSVSAETLLMPKRDARTTAPVVVWGVHTQAAGTVCALDFGDLTPVQNCTGVDRSYIAYSHTYASQGTYTARLTVGAETTTTEIQVFEPALMVGGATGDNNRSLGINMAIQDGLRYLWTNQTSRAANFPASTTTSWTNTSFNYADTSLVTLAFENQGYKIQANVPPTGIYE